MLDYVVISECFFKQTKKNLKNGEFCVAILKLLTCPINITKLGYSQLMSPSLDLCQLHLVYLKMEGKQHFQHIMLYYFKKGKNANKTHTHTQRFVQCMEKVL